MKHIIATIAVAVPLLFTTACAETTDGTAADGSSQDENTKKPKYTSSQEAAIGAAQNYVDTMPFSRKGLVDQLSSPAGDKYPKKDAVFAVNHIKVDWNAEAVEAVENYQATMPMSEQAMYDQLTSPAGDKFTKKQADYAIKKAY
ncbi:Ltp family lipoprotein [Nocardioides sp. NPDC059952]|uniref:Ltp family lipoprotein n=1 Tax=Nocardioides sp. NPDC059952 TaxID=3347014 RepID=UPI003668D8D1